VAADGDCKHLAGTICEVAWGGRWKAGEDT
jgi:hypothetical protein